MGAGGDQGQRRITTVEITRRSCQGGRRSNSVTKAWTAGSSITW